MPTVSGAATLVQAQTLGTSGATLQDVRITVSALIPLVLPRAQVSGPVVAATTPKVSVMGEVPGLTVQALTEAV